MRLGGHRVAEHVELDVGAAGADVGLHVGVGHLRRGKLLLLHGYGLVLDGVDYHGGLGKLLGLELALSGRYRVLARSKPVELSRYDIQPRGNRRVDVDAVKVRIDSLRNQLVAAHAELNRAAIKPFDLILR